MSWNLGILLLTGLTVHEASASIHFTNYTEAYRVARQRHRPMLVILNPDHNSDRKRFNLGDLGATEDRRQLLDGYVVVLLDTGKRHGRTMHRLFGNDPLPHVAVIDDQQRFQVYQTSAPESGRRLTEILETYSDEVEPRGSTPEMPAPFCFT